MTMSGRARLRGASLPTSLRSFCSARSRTLHVLSTTKSACSTSSTATPPAARKTPAMRSVSCTFIWQPKVWMTYRKVTASTFPIARLGRSGDMPWRHRQAGRGMEYSPRYKTLCDIFDEAVTQHGTREIFGTKVGGEWRYTTYAEFGALVDRLRGGLASLGVERGDRVAMVSNNRVEWAVAAFACYTLGAVFVPMYEAQSPSEWEFVARECEAKVLFLANASGLAKARGFPSAMPWLRALVVVSGEPNGVSSELGSKVTTYAALLDTGKEVKRVQPTPDETAVIIYTSG